MRINSIPPKELYRQYVHVKGKEPVAAQSAHGTDKVEFTQDALSFSATLKAAKAEIATSDTGEAKLQNLKERIEGNNYSVSGYLVARRMLGKPDEE